MMPDASRLRYFAADFDAVHDDAPRFIDTSR